jgi:TRAP-type C4-dicarboxylate transport system permease small subunit
MPAPVALEYKLLEGALLVLLALNATAIVSRYIFNHAIGELFEIMILGSVAAYWLGIATAERERAHLGVTVAVSVLPSRLRRPARLLRLLVVAGFLAAVVYSGGALVLSQYRLNMTSGILDMPLWIFAAFMPIGAALMLIRAVWAELPGSAG